MTSKPNILIIVTEDQGYGDLTAFSHHAPDVQTPNMDRLAERGVLFSQAYVTAPVCSPSRAGWNTGRHQVPKRYLDKHGVREIPNYDPETMGGYEDWFKRYITLGEINAEEFRRYYLANLNCLDDNIGRLLDTLDQLSLADNTIVILFSDNGGAPNTGACNLPLAGSKFTLWEGGIRVPFILARPNESASGTICDRPISTRSRLLERTIEAGDPR